MGRHDKARRSAMTSKARRDFALGRIELREPSDPRRPAASPTSFAVKADDPETRTLIEQFLDRKRKGQ